MIVSVPAFRAARMSVGGLERAFVMISTEKTSYAKRRGKRSPSECPLPLAGSIPSNAISW
jgi:hypothetical protein